MTVTGAVCSVDCLLSFAVQLLLLPVSVKQDVGSLFAEEEEQEEEEIY